MKHASRKFWIIVVVFLGVGGLLGGLLGSRAQAEPRWPEDELRLFGEVLAVVEDEFVGEVDSTDLVESAIAGMLRTLDPHSNYLDPEAASEMRDEQRGKFHGLGIQITKRGPEKPLTIISPIDDTPASRAGLQSGDIISEIEGEPTINLTVHEAVRRLKGDKGTQVTITIERPGSPDSFEVTIERDTIPIESIRVAYIVAPGVGFIRISNFTSTTARELDQAVATLREQGMTKLLLDLRGNPGGLLDQAVQVAERFIPAGKEIVLTKGRVGGSNNKYVAKQGVNRIDMPLIILVDQSSASASEIVSGAVQDHDRGLVVGETTFGKGLVQRFIPLRDAAGALVVTTAKYYTPSGRLIQRDYSDLAQYYFTRADDDLDIDAVSRGAEETDVATKEVDADEERETFRTASGRVVYGGGGIRPDYIVKAPRAPQLLLKLVRENLVFDYGVLYANEHPQLEQSFRVDQAVLKDFRAFLAQREFEFDAEKFEEHKDAIGLRLSAQIARVGWNQVGEAKILAQADPQIQRALTLFDEAADLAVNAGDDKPGRWQRDVELRAEVEPTSP